MTESLTFSAILEARERLAPHAVRTPLIESPVLNERIGARVLVKAETLQRTGSFKFRGAYNKISRLDRRAFPGGIVACSSGNHAQGAAEAARLCSVKAVIVMPSDAPRLKIQRTRDAGSELVLYDRENEDRNAIALDLCARLQAQFVPPFDDWEIMAGQGTAGLELMEQARVAGAEIEAALIPASGGGLAAGVGTAMKHFNPDCRIYCVEPHGFDDHARSLANGRREKNAKLSGSICDALLAPEPGGKTFAVNQRQLAGALTATDDEAMAAMAFAYHHLKLVAEPGGALALAALLAGRYKPRGQAIAVILSGGNVDPELYAAALMGGA